MSDGKSLNIQIMNVHIMFSRFYKIAAALLVFLFISVISFGQDYDPPPTLDEMSSLKKLVLGIEDTQIDRNGKIKVLKNIDFETYVEREILIEKWMHDKDLWMHRANEMHESMPIEDWMHSRGAWNLIDSDLGRLQKPEPEPSIELAEWMYADEFVLGTSEFRNSSQLEAWMSDRSFWIVKK